MTVRRVAVLSDTHGHLTALRAVLADADASGVTEVVVAGDIVNFGPSSAAVVDLLRECGARLVRGNHEVELVAPYGTPGMPEWLRSSVRYTVARFTMEQLGAERRAFLAALPDRLELDAATLVTHGSPRHVRDGVTESRTDEELRAFWNGHHALTAFVGHTHRPVVRVVPPAAEAAEGEAVRRFVNVGSAGFNLDGDPRVSYALATPGPSGNPGDWQVEIRRVAYDVEAGVREFDNGYRDACGEYAEVFSRQLRTGRHYFGPWVRASGGLPEDEVLPSLRRFLAENP
ncbi:MAG: hypothetical protein AVDCRST_MAG77-3923 [uncultured Chloroflexi bacterium]|uniref:Calcineurin-like phosphoesterase domain-containing protein n=1 Tax=uncultured Chloroflexota bacterium TaxID=166587 RepID=A0A6J4JM04_9CHLR|nr:MAG: hypothetical protein AVDCRST_MAG77-3923 [uncultured Chloroflexota bacterium]